MSTRLKDYVDKPIPEMAIIRKVSSTARRWHRAGPMFIDVSCGPIGLPLGPPGRKDDRAQMAAEWMVTELGGEICDHRSPNVSESLWTPIHDGDVDGVAFD